MPGGDGTGPAGMGPMTGREAGYCAGYPVPGFMNPITGRGFGWGRGFRRGRGFGPGFSGWGGYWGAPYAVPAYSYGAPYGAWQTPEQEAGALKEQVKYFEDALAGIRNRIAELEATTE